MYKNQQSAPTSPRATAKSAGYIPRHSSILIGVILVILASGCRLDRETDADLPTPVAISPESATAYPNPTDTPLAAPSPVPSATFEITAIAATPIPTPEPLPTATNSPAPSPTADIYAGLAIQELADRSYGGGTLEIIDTLSSNDVFTRYLITYPSDGLTIYGFMNVPHDGSKFPVAIVVHGYIPPEEYNTVTYTTRYADSLAEAGYLVIHPNLRNYPPSDSGPDPFRTGYAIDILNLIAIIKEQSQDPLGTLRRADSSNINLWGHSMGGGIVLRTITVNNDPDIRAAVLYASMSGDEISNYQKILEWSGGREGNFELSAPADVVQQIAPINHLNRIQAPISIHHSSSDQVVPPEWSADLCQRLRDLDHPVECFTYEGLPHTFSGAGDTLFINRVIDFFNRH